MKWISVEERLPKDREPVLWLHDLKLRDKYHNIFDGPKYMVGYYIEEINSVCLDDFDEYDNWFKIDELTHWMPLPKPPKDNNNTKQ